MKDPNHHLKQPRPFSARIGAALGLFVAFALLVVSPASAAYEQVGTFAPGEATQGLAVNISGAGGVPAGTLYAVGRSTPLTRYSAKGELLGKWQVLAQGVAVHQGTGNVYVIRNANPGDDVVRVYNADGSQLIDSFGVKGTNGESVDEGPEKIHSPWFSSGIAVDSSGVVYVSDVGASRVMVFEPQSPGDYEHYVYTGLANDITVPNGGLPSNGRPEALAIDSASLFVAANETEIYEFALSDPAFPTCEFQRPSGGIEGITVNLQGGEVFYFTYKTQKIHQLAPCNAQGKLVETTSFTPSPKPDEVSALAFNPTLAYEPSRPPGVLYATGLVAFGGGSFGYIFAPAEVNPPVVESQSVSSVTSTTAALAAQINPKGSETRYIFQYITEAAYQANEPTGRFAGATEAPLGGADLGAGQEGLPASVSLVGLQPDTEYRYRVIASSYCDPEKEEELCEDVGSPQAFHTFPVEAPGLADNRAWELVSPVQKHGGEVIPAYPSIASCGDDCKPAANAKRSRR